MANGIGRVWAANAGDDEQRPNGVGSVWIENIDALAPSGGASEQQINELSAAIDYVSANAGDPNALTGYQADGVEISANPGFFEVSSNQFDLHVGEGGHLSANNSCSAVFTNGSKFINTNGSFISADGYNGFLVSGNRYNISNNSYGELTYSGANISASLNPYGFYVSSNSYNLSAGLGGPSNTDLLYASRAGTNFKVDITGVNYSRPQYGVSANIGGWRGAGIGCIAQGSVLEVHGGGHLSANNSCSAIFTNGSRFESSNGSRTEITNGHTLVVGNNDKGTSNGIIVSGYGNEFIKIYNQGSVKVVDSTEVNLSALTHKIGSYINASGSRFVSADSEDVSAWAPAPMTVMGAYNDTSSNAAFVIGNGSANAARSDLFVIDYSGNAKSNDFVAGENSLTAMANKINELEQILQTYSGQWLLNADNA